MPQPHSVADALERASSDLDTIIQELRLGTRNVAHHDELEERAQRVSLDVRGAFRGEQATARTKPGRNGGVWAY